MPDPGRAQPREVPVAPAIVRWAIATIAVSYGFAKLNGSQFTVLESELDKPMGDVEGFWLTWYYFGYSPIYGNLVALIQVAAGLLSTSRRFALAGALLLLPVAVNIVLIDVFYGVDLGGLLAALVLLLLLTVVVAPHVRRLVNVVVTPAPDSKRAWIGRVVLLTLAFAATYWVANVNNRSPTPIDGVWSVTPGSAFGYDRVFFERNRAHLVVLRDTGGSYEWHHFEIDAEGRVRVWEEWLGKGQLLYEGSHDERNALIVLRGVSDSTSVLSLSRLEPR